MTLHQTWSSNSTGYHPSCKTWSDSTFYKHTWTCLTHWSPTFNQLILRTGKSTSFSIIFFLNHTVLRLVKWQITLFLVQVKMLLLWSSITFSCLKASTDISMRIAFTWVSHNKRQWSSLTAHGNINNRQKWGGVQYRWKLMLLTQLQAM
jgi:hypothetical protein